MTTDLLRLRCEDFGCDAVCTGDQIAEVIELVDRVSGRLRWYVADLE